jgi:hypothetical protein
VTSRSRKLYTTGDFQPSAVSDREYPVLDLTGIMFSSIMMLIVIVRALQLDRTQPWFQKVKFKEKPTPENQRAWQREP